MDDHKFQVLMLRTLAQIMRDQHRLVRTASLKLEKTDMSRVLDESPEILRLMKEIESYCAPRTE